MTAAGPFETRHLDEAVARAAPALRELDGAALLVTGATGFLGRWLLALLDRARAALGLELAVTALSRDPNAFAAAWPGLAERVAWIAGDVRDLAAPGRFSHVVHAATDTSLAADRDPEALSTAIVEGTRRVLARARGARLLYLSSGAVYGPQPPDLAHLPETHLGGPDPLDPRAAYAEAKRFAEGLCARATARGEVEAVVARGFAFSGPGLPLDGHFAIGNFVRDAVAGRPVRVAGDGTPVRAYLDAADAAAWLVTLLARGRPGTAYNLGSDRAVTIAGLARLVAETVPGAAGVTIEGRPDPGAARHRYVPAIARARHLGLEAWTPLEDSIRRMAAFAGRG